MAGLELAGAPAVVTGMHLEAVAGPDELDPQIVAGGVPEGVGDDLLHAAHDGVSLLWIVDLEARRHAEMDRRRRDTLGERLEHPGEIDRVPAAERADDVADVGEQELGPAPGSSRPGRVPRRQCGGERLRDSS